MMIRTNCTWMKSLNTLKIWQNVAKVGRQSVKLHEGQGVQGLFPAFSHHIHSRPCIAGRTVLPHLSKKGCPQRKLLSTHSKTFASSTPQDEHYRTMHQRSNTFLPIDGNRWKICNHHTPQRVYCSGSTPQESKPKPKPTKKKTVLASEKEKSHGIQKHVQPLSSKRVGRRKKGQGAQGKSQEMVEVTAYAPSEEIDLESLVQELKRDGLYSVVPFPSDTDDVDDSLHMEANYKVDNLAREIFFFRDGAVVFWNMPEEERHSVMNFIRPHQEHSYDPQLVEGEVEHMQATYTDTVSRLVGAEIQLQKQESSTIEARSNQLEKYSFSNALALSVKLAIWEASLETYVDSIEYILEDLKEGKKLKISRQEVLRKTGEVLTLRHLINLSSDLLDVPDFYWDRDELETLYKKTCQQHSISRRVKVMNEKLNHCYELTGLLREHLNDKHHTHLEVLIIFLIAVEVIFEITKML